jgi:hypothetical protein
MDDPTLMDLFGSLSREIGALRQDVRDEFDRVETRLGRQGDERIAEWARRLDKLEGKKE